MSTLESELRHLKGKYSDDLTRDEALDLALQAAELHMKFLNIAKEGPERRRLSNRCNSLLDEAERIKTGNDWQHDSDSLISFEPLQPLSSHVSRTAQSPNLLAEPTAVSRRAESLQSRTSSSSAAKSGSSSTHAYQSSASLRTLGAPVPPKSSRQTPKKEQLLLWQGSELHGCKFPPWETPPSVDDFDRLEGEPLYVDTTEFVMSDDQVAILDDWKRPSEALPPPIWKFEEGSTEHSDVPSATMQRQTPSDFVQDAATDCSVVASLAAGAARAHNGHDKLLSSLMFPYDSKRDCPHMSSNGKYVVRLNFNGCSRKVVIDDRLPVSKTERVLHVVDRNNPTLLWPALIEKAYLKARGGYDFPGSNSGTDLWILAGWIPEQVFLQHEETSSADLWSRVADSFESGDVIVTLGTGKMTEKAEHDSGLAGEHDYAVLHLKQEKGRRMLMIKNPWLNATAWKDQRIHLEGGGATKETAPQGTAPRAKPTPSGPTQDASEYKHLLGPGTFWMEIGDVMQHFDSMYLNWNPSFFTYREDIHFTWDLGAGHSILGSFADNPQFSVRPQGGGALWLLLQRHFVGSQGARAKSIDAEAEDEGFLSLYAFEDSGSRVYLSKGATEQGMYVDSPQMLLRLDARPNTQYIVVASEEGLADRRHTLTMSAFAESSLTLDHAYSRYTNKTKEKSSWTKASAGGNAQFDTYSQNPQFSLELPEGSPVSLLLETSTEHVSVHVKLVHGQGQRMYNMANRDIIVDSGNYRRGVAHAQIEHLMAGKYTVICSTFEQNQLADFSLHIESLVKHVVKPVPKEGAGRIHERLADASFSSGSRVLASPMEPRKLARVNLRIRYVPSSTSRILDSEDASPSPTRLTIELGRGPDRQILIASGNGSFVDLRREVRTEDVDISPNLTRKDKTLWLVLERMGGFEGSASPEERISVEMFTDAADPITFGVWREWHPNID